jgi:fructose-bisphosphate aldolase class II
LLSQSARLDIERLEAIHQCIPETPLVLHGASGVIEDSVVESLDHGISKVNVATYLAQGFTTAMFDCLKANPDVEDPRKHLVPAREAAKERVRAKIRLFRAAGTVSGSSGFKSPPTQHRVADIGEAE